MPLKTLILRDVLIHSQLTSHSFSVSVEQLYSTYLQIENFEVDYSLC